MPGHASIENQYVLTFGSLSNALQTNGNSTTISSNVYNGDKRRKPIQHVLSMEIHKHVSMSNKFYFCPFLLEPLNLESKDIASCHKDMALTVHLANQ